MTKELRELVPEEGKRYRVGIAWWTEDAIATFKDGAFIVDGYEGDGPYAKKYVTALEEVAG